MGLLHLAQIAIGSKRHKKYQQFLGCADQPENIPLKELHMDI
jgi:hypothetical protein